jgi:hypothetical protein
MGRERNCARPYVKAIGRRVVVVRAFVKKARTAAGEGGHMTIPFEKLKARLLASPKVRTEYDALAPEFEIATELLRARLRAGLSKPS